jgi:signal transduction histidine kinase
LEVRDRLLILKKPFDAIEVRQLASTLTAKWQMTQDATAQVLQLEEIVEQRTREITRTNEALQDEIGERKHLQGQLLQSEKLASIGQLAAGVAHEINNPIGYIFSNFGTLEGYLGQLFDMLAAYERAEASVNVPDIAAGLRELRERIELEFLKEDIPVLMRESRQGIVRVRQIVQDLKDFSRVDSTQDFQWANLHHGIDSTLNVVASEIKYKADVVKEYGSIPDVECLPSQINQVVMNLVINAAHAMGERRGCITIRTGAEGDEVWLEVADNGSGIPPDTLKRIFEPFFTTKQVGVGTGLGLSVSYGIVQKHRGRIDVDSVPGQGTTFRVTLPQCRPAPQDEEQSIGLH